MTSQLATAFFLYGCPLGLAFAAFQYLFWLSARRQTAYLYWGAANLMFVVATVLTLLRGVIPWWVSSLFANTVLIGGSVLLWMGIRCVAGQPLRVREFVAFVCLFALVYQGIVLFRNDLGLRVLVVSATLVLTNVAMAAELWRQQRGQYLAMRNVLIAAMAFHALFYIYRGVRGAMLEADSDLLRTASDLDLAIIVGMLKSTIWNLAVVLMVREARPVSAEPHGGRSLARASAAGIW